MSQNGEGRSWCGKRGWSCGVYGYEAGKLQSADRCRDVRVRRVRNGVGEGRAESAEGVRRRLLKTSVAESL